LFMMIEEPLYILVGIIPTLTFLIFFTAIGESTKKSNFEPYKICQNNKK